MTRRVGLIGLGAAVNKHVLALQELRNRAEIVAAWSPSEERRTAFAVRTGVPVVDTEAAVLDAADLVLVLSPPWTHLPIVERCAARGRDVLLEKPMEATAERAEAVVRVCEAAGVTLGVVFQNRFRSPHLRLREMLPALGRPLSVSASVRWWRPASYYHVDAGTGPGRGTRARDGGGVLLSQAIHVMDQVVDLAGLPAEVAGFHANSRLRAVDTEDVVAAALRWENGAVGVLDATTAAFPRLPERIDIAAEHGSAVLERTRLRVTLQDGTVLDESEDPDDPAVAGDYLAHRRLLVDLLDALDAGRAPGPFGRDALRVHRLIDAVLRAGESGGVTRP